MHRRSPQHSCASSTPSLFQHASRLSSTGSTPSPPHDLQDNPRPGFTLCLYIMTVNNLKEGLRASWKLVAFLSVQRVALHLGVAGKMNLVMLAFIDNRNIFGGPIAYQSQFSNHPFAFVALTGFTISTWLQDVFLLVRSL
ncbi:hypothetical protein JB92DRAFT_3023610 [Gautieria morchelliformis]|nr:hypothetical protein JB92DRAFT_3023610 [Gautieria morchelliformis]